MRRAYTLCLLLAAGCAAPPSAATRPAGTAPGDVLEVAQDTYGAADWIALDGLFKSVRASDVEGLRELLEGGRAVDLPAGTRVRVLAGAPTPPSMEGVSPSQGFLECRILSGPHERERVFLYAGALRAP